MKSLILFLQHVLEDLSTWSGIESTSHDLEYVMARTENEGISFLTITLPEFGKAFERGLDQGWVDRSSFPKFRTRKGEVAPEFLRGFLGQVFDAQSGRLLDEPSIVAIWAIRQITLMFAKINLPCSPERERAAIDAYVQCEQDVIASDILLENSPRMAIFERISMLLWANVLSKVNEEVYYGRIVPGHGPGATADKLKGNLKWSQLEWTDRLDRVFPVEEMLTVSWSFREEAARIDILEPGAERPVKVITVPKTLKTPRVIAVEPTCMQYVQQGLLHSIRAAVEADDLASKLVGWSSQIPNQKMARTGSLVGDLATLDLSEASDRVSNLHVRSLCARFTHLSEGIQACRSLKADVPGHGIIPLSKFASMGSALTFPLEAMVFCTIVFMAVERKLNRQLSKKDIKSFLGQVRVYGDDIIVPVDMVPYVVEELEAFGLKVNSSKSFWNGKFRESCGKEYYAGEDVSIVRLRSVLPTRRRHASEIISTVSTRNQLYTAGLWNAAAYLDSILGRLIPYPKVETNFTVKGDLSSIEGNSPLLGAYSFLGYDASLTKWDSELHRPLIKGVVAHGDIPESLLEGHSALLKVLTKRSDLPFADVRHLERAGRPRSVTIKTRWSTPY